jgi:hypothetical protein
MSENDTYRTQWSDHYMAIRCTYGLCQAHIVLRSSVPTSAARFETGNTILDIAGAPLSRDAMTAGLDPCLSTSCEHPDRIDLCRPGSKGEDSSFKLSASISF